MTEELQANQQLKTLPYILTGATIGGLTTGFGIRHYAKPKYNSYQDIVNEAKDETNFQSKINNAEGEFKSFLEAAKEIANAEKEEEIKLENELKKIIEKNEATEENALEIFLEKGGFNNKTEYIEKQVEAKINAFKTKYEKEFKNKLGNNAGRKLTALTLAAVIIGGFLGKVLSPKNNVRKAE